MLDEEGASCSTRMVLRMSTASFEYGLWVPAADRPRSCAGHARPAADRVVQERLVDADQLPAGGRGVGRWARREPAHQLADSRLHLPPEEQPAVPGQRITDAIQELPDDPEVDVADAVARQHEQVGRVQVGMEVAQHEDLVERVPVEVTNDPVEVVSGRLEPPR